jgi:hypothetical protein
MKKNEGRNDVTTSWRVRRDDVAWRSFEPTELLNEMWRGSQTGQLASDEDFWCGWLTWSQLPAQRACDKSESEYES